MYAEEALALARVDGDTVRGAIALGRLGSAYGMTGGPDDLLRSHQLQEESIAAWPAGERSPTWPSCSTLQATRCTGPGITAPRSSDTSRVRS